MEPLRIMARMSRSEEKWAMAFWIVLAWWGCMVGGELLVCCGWLRRKFVCVESWAVYVWRDWSKRGARRQERRQIIRYSI